MSSPSPDAPLAAERDVHVLLYRSMATSVLSDVGLRRLVQTAERNNALADVTGLLLYAPVSLGEAGMFVQWIEGAADVVRPLYHDRIARDPRHRHCEVIYDGPIERITGRDARRFSRWSLRGEIRTLGDFPVTLEGFLERAPVYDRWLRMGDRDPGRTRTAVKA